MKVIVDGVNVAECKHFRKNYTFDCGVQSICCQYPNCYYKQLIRLKQQHNDDTEEIAKLGLDVAILEQETKN